LAWLIALSAWAGDKAAATALFEEGMKLLDAGEVDEACPKFVASIEAYPSPGGMLNLARCHREQGKTATAWAEYNQAAEMFDKVGSERASFARSEAAALEAKLSKLTVTVESPVAGLQVLRDGVALKAGAYGVAVPVDPGEHKIVAAAPGHEPWSTAVTVGPDGDTKTIAIPALIEGPEPGPGDSGQTEPDGSGDDSLAFYIGAGVAGAVGVAGFILGGVFGSKASSDWDSAREQCPENGNYCTAEAVTLAADAKSSATVSTVGFVLGGAGLVTAGVLILLTLGGEPDPPGDAASGSVRIFPMVLPGSGSVLLQGRF